MNFTLSPNYKSRRADRQTEERTEDLPLWLVALLATAVLTWWLV